MAQPQTLVRHLLCPLGPAPLEEIPGPKADYKQGQEEGWQVGWRGSASARRRQVGCREALLSGQPAGTLG